MTTRLPGWGSRCRRGRSGSLTAQPVQTMAAVVVAVLQPVRIQAPCCAACFTKSPFRKIRLLARRHMLIHEHMANRTSPTVQHHARRLTPYPIGSRPVCTRFPGPVSTRLPARHAWKPDCQVSPPAVLAHPNAQQPRRVRGAALPGTEGRIREEPRSSCARSGRTGQ